jgi:hypothetical protein
MVLKPRVEGKTAVLAQQVLYETSRDVKGQLQAKASAGIDTTSVPTAEASPPHTPAGPASSTVQQAVPNIILEKLKPTINVLNEPSTPLGRVVVVLADSERHDRWTKKRIRQKIVEHAWDDDGADEEIDRLIQWEILRWQSNGYLRFYPERVRVVERELEMTAS